MTVSSTQIRVSYTGNGVSVAFPVPFPFYAATDLSVLLAGALLSSGYSVSGGGGSTGTVTMSSAPLTGVNLQIILTVPLTQTVALVDGTQFPAATLNQQADRNVQAELRLQDQISRSIRAPDGDTSPAMLLPSAVTRASTYPLFDSNGNLTVGVSLPSGTLSQATIGAFLYPRTTAEIAAGVTPTSYAYPPGDARRYGWSGDSGVTDNTTALQNAFSACAGFCPVFVVNMGGYGKLTGRVTAPANSTLQLLDGAELRWTATTSTGSTLLGTATRPGIEVTGDNFRIEGRGLITGPSVASYVAFEIGIFAKGTSTGSRKSGFSIGGQVEFSNWGYAGWITQFVDNLDVEGFYAHDIGHAGFFCFSCTHGDIRSFRVRNMTPGVGGFAYGFSLLHDSTGYDTDPNLATPRLVANPFCIDFTVHDFVIEDVPIWEGADIHGGYEVEFYNFAVYNCRHGVVFGAGSGAAVNYAGENNKVHHGHCTTKKRDGSATAVVGTDRNGIVLKGGSVVQHKNCQADHISLDGFGDNGNTSFGVYAQYVRQAQINNITHLNWKGEAIYSADGDGVISENIFEGVADATNARCINIDTTTGEWVIVGNKHRPITGTAATEGLRYQAGNPRCTLIGNDFDYATTPYIFSAGESGLQTRGNSDITPVVNATGTPTSVTVSGAGRAPIVRVTFNTSGPSTVSDFPGAQPGQVIQCEFPTTNVTTIDRTNSVLSGGANFASTQYDIISLRCVNTSGVKFYEIARSVNS